MILILGCGYDRGPADGPGVRGFHGPGGSFRRSQGWAARGSGSLRKGSDPGPGGDDRFNPGPGRSDSEVPAPGAAGKPGGSVQDLVAQGLWLGAGQVAVEGEQPEPGEQGRGGQRGGQPGGVDREVI